MVALGGNALLAQGEQGTYEEQRANAAAMAVSICALLDAGWRVVVVHGNGPQVGNLAIQQELGRTEVPEMPLFSLGAMTEGQLGSLIAIALYGVCGRRHRIAALLSHVIVDLDDPAFAHPTKPIGPFFSEEAATRLAETRGWDISEDAGRGFRRVVASPLPKGFVEIEAISLPARRGPGRGDRRRRRDPGGPARRRLGRRGRRHRQGLCGRRARPPAPGRGARPHHGGRRRADRLRKAQPASADLDGHREAERHLAAGQFPAGSMGPKVSAAVGFVERGEGRAAVITTPELVVNTLANQDPAEGSVGTRIVAAAVRHDSPDDTAADHPQEAPRDRGHQGLPPYLRGLGRAAAWDARDA